MPLLWQLKRIKDYEKIVNTYIIVQMCIVILVVIVSVIWDKRYRKNHGLDVPEGFEKNEEKL